MMKTKRFLGYSKKLFSTVSKDTEGKYKFLVTGCGGQIGVALTKRMTELYGENNVILTDITEKIGLVKNPKQIFERLDVTDLASYKYLMEKHNINYIVHLSGILSAAGEKNPFLAMKVNGEGVVNALDMAKEYNSKIFIPSTIAVFGPDTVKRGVPNNVALNPTTIYGVTKVFMENMGNYYRTKHNVDFRSLRYPGVISPYEYESHGTTDYASEIFFAAIKSQEYKICLSSQTALPMAYLDDIINGTLQFMETEEQSLSTRVYNVQGLTFSCEELASALALNYQNFRYKYEPDFRDKIAKNWPQSIDDQLARKDWKWSPTCNDVKSLIETMKANIRL